MGVLLSVGIWLGKLVFDTGLELAGFAKTEADRELARLNASVAALAREKAELVAANLRMSQQLEIEQATHKELSKTLKALQEENATLREDNAFFRNLLSPAGGVDKVTIHDFKVERNPLLAGEYRYRLLLLKAGKREEEFTGSVELLITGTLQGQRVTHRVPSPPSGQARPIEVRFKYYQRLEGGFRVPEGTVVRSVQVRVFERGGDQPRWTKTVNL